jgi:hypothetical protein
MRLDQLSLPYLTVMIADKTVFALQNDLPGDDTIDGRGSERAAGCAVLGAGTNGGQQSLIRGSTPRDLIG